ncbi:MAG: GxxExxY protein [Spartobacteria bacterium]
MGVECGTPVVWIDQERFHEIDRIVMGQAFALQNEMGRFFDERIYQEELLRRCSDAGMSAQREVSLRVSHRDFHKDYFLDFLVENSALFELKAVDGLNSKHQAQLLNYLHLLNLQHGKLIYFRPKSVESRFVSTQLTKEKRLQFTIEKTEWDSGLGESEVLGNALAEMLGEWGAFLDSNLYREALLHLTAEISPGFQEVEIVRSGMAIGIQKMCLLTPDTAWHLSAHHEHLDSYEIHMRRLLNHTNLRAIHWINMNKHQVILKTLKK